MVTEINILDFTDEKRKSLVDVVEKTLDGKGYVTIRRSNRVHICLSDDLGDYIHVADLRMLPLNQLDIYGRSNIDGLVGVFSEISSKTGTRFEYTLVSESTKADPRLLRRLYYWTMDILFGDDDDCTSED